MNIKDQSDDTVGRVVTLLCIWPTWVRSLVGIWSQSPTKNDFCVQNQEKPIDTARGSPNTKRVINIKWKEVWKKINSTSENCGMRSRETICELLKSLKNRMKIRSRILIKEIIDKNFPECIQSAYPKSLKNPVK